MVLCTWEGERWLPVLLRSLAAQTRRPDELVVQDDRSTDGTVALVERFAETAPFPVRLAVNGERLGSTRNFATALGRARGDVLALADQDDVWYPGKLARLQEEFDADPTVTMVFSDADLVGEDGRRLGARLWSARLVGRTLRANPVIGVGDFARRPLTTGCTMAVRRRAVEAALPLPPELDDPALPMRHDRWLSLVAAAVGTVRALPEPLLGFRVHPGQETGVLVGDARTAAARRTLRHVATAAPTADQHHTRATQLEVAARRADDLGDFASARELRQVAAHHRMRSEVGGGRGRLGPVLHDVRQGRYGLDVLGVGAVGADLVRVVRGRLR